jgi:hypothetical protein
MPIIPDSEAHRLLLTGTGACSGLRYKCRACRREDVKVYDEENWVGAQVPCLASVLSHFVRDQSIGQGKSIRSQLIKIISSLPHEAIGNQFPDKAIACIYLCGKSNIRNIAASAHSFERDYDPLMGFLKPFWVLFHQSPLPHAKLRSRRLPSLSGDRFCVIVEHPAAREVGAYAEQAFKCDAIPKSSGDLALDVVSIFV